MGDTPAGGEGLDQALARIAEADRLLVALDFDGTLAPFADDPAAVAPLPGSWAAVLTLDRARATDVALVSGRPLAGLAEVTRPPEGVSLIGSHGVEWRVPGHDEGALSATETARVERICAALDATADAHAGVRVERKPAGAALHTRGTAPEVAAAAQSEARLAVRAVDADTLVRGGKDILEFAVRHVTKGDALDRLRALVHADAVFFAGDDVTDEDAFAVLRRGDVGVKVGDGETAAGYRVADPVALSEVLRTLARARAVRPR